MEMQLPEPPFCQSCSMALRKPEDFGTNADGSRSDGYCTHCFQNGRFTDPDRTLEQMIERVAGFMTAEMDLPEAEARESAAGFVSKLKRWQT